MEEKVLVVEENIRIDKYLASILSDYSRANISSWIKDGLVTIDGRVVKASEKTVRDSLITIDIPKPESSILLAENIPLDILYEDEDILVLNKPQGMVVHPGAGNPNGTLVNALLHHTGGNLSSIDQGTRPGILHRLDKDTSGLLLVAKNNISHRRLAEDLKERKITRIYECIVYGFFKEKQGIIEAPIGRDSKDRIKMAVHAEGKYAKTYFRVLESLKHGTYLRVKLDTGRTHQIRVHMHFIGHPVMGDRLYASKRKHFGLEGQCLHARELHFMHPRTGEQMKFQTPLPSWFTSTLQTLGYQEENLVQWSEAWPQEEIDEEENFKMET